MEEFKFKNGVSFDFVEYEKNYFRIGIFLEKEEVGFCKFRKNKDGTYYFSAGVIFENFRSKKASGKFVSKHSHLGANLLEEINHFLKTKKAIGYLNNTIIDRNKAGSYFRHGWKQVRENLYMFDGRS